MIAWQWCRFDELSARQVYALLAARAAVFVIEQNCIYQDLDGHDLGAAHLVGWSGDDIAACLRLLQPGVTFTEMSIGRVLTMSRFRGIGTGRELLRRAVDRIDEQHPQPVRIGAQAHLQKFYSEFGFVADSALYLEDGIPHVEMLRPARASSPATSARAWGVGPG